MCVCVFALNYLCACMSARSRTESAYAHLMSCKRPLSFSPLRLYCHSWEAESDLHYTLEINLKNQMHMPFNKFVFFKIVVQDFLTLWLFSFIGKSRNVFCRDLCLVWKIVPLLHWHTKWLVIQKADSLVGNSLRQKFFLTFNGYQFNVKRHNCLKENTNYFK